MSMENLIIAICMGLTFALLYAVHQLNQRLKQTHQVIKGLQSDISALCAGAVGVSEHLDKIEDQSRYLADRQDQINVSASSDRPYMQAMRLAEKGVDIEELMTTCDLAKEEASLICALYNNSADAKTSSSLDLRFE